MLRLDFWLNNLQTSKESTKIMFSYIEMVQPELLFLAMTYILKMYKWTTIYLITVQLVLSLIALLKSK